MIATQNYTWTDEQKATILEHQAFHMNMTTFLNKVVMEGPTKTFPRKPKSNLKQVIMTKKTKGVQKRSHEQLHAYLVENFIETKKTIDRDVFLFTLEDITTEEQALEKLKDGFKHLKRQNAQTLFFFIQYGMLLNAVYKKIFELRIQGIITITWGKWLLENIGIHPSYARRLRECAKSLGGYYKLYKVGLSFTEIFKLKKELVALFNSSPEMNTFWKQDPDICSTREMESFKPSLPKRPKSKLDSLFTHAKKKKTFDPKELHDYLRSKCVDQCGTCGRHRGVIPKEQVLEILKRATRQIKRCEAQMLLFYIKFGTFLEQVKAWHENEYNKKTIQESWPVWLKTNAGYSDRHARRLRNLSMVLKDYPLFGLVGLPVSYFTTGKLKDITEMLSIPTYAEYWKQPLPTATNEMPQSQ